MRDDHRPWYREPWVWFVAALPAAAVAGSFAALGFAIATDDGVVAEDYYKQGLAVNQVLRRDARARELHLEATARFSGERVEVVLQGAQARFPQLRLRLIHPTRSGLDQTVVLMPSGTAYAGRFTSLDGGPRLIVLEDSGATWRLTATWNGHDPQSRLEPGG